MKSKLLRFLVSALKNDQHAPSKVYAFVPLQDFTSESDIDWSTSISDIDAQLYRKYDISREDQEFIESRIRPME
ncbi:MAG: hypothetical protein IJS15_05005 [Victivallales bacterium]|nr:hypothetical protein [Victivallales bacterium]